MSTTNAKLIEALRVTTNALESGVIYAPEELGRWLEKEKALTEMSHDYDNETLFKTAGFEEERRRNIHCCINLLEHRSRAIIMCRFTCHAPGCGRSYSCHRNIRRHLALNHNIAIPASLIKTIAKRAAETEEARKVKPTTVEEPVLLQTTTIQPVELPQSLTPSEDLTQPLTQSLLVSRLRPGAPAFREAAYKRRQSPGTMGVLREGCSSLAALRQWPRPDSLPTSRELAVPLSASVPVSSATRLRLLRIIHISPSPILSLTRGITHALERRTRCPTDTTLEPLTQPMTLDEDDQIVKLSEPTVNQPLEKENDGDIIVDKVILAKGKNITETPKHRPPSIVCKGRFKLRHSIMYYEDVKTEHRWIRF